LAPSLAEASHADAFDMMMGTVNLACLWVLQGTGV
jgi:hypothetical protein